MCLGCGAIACTGREGKHAAEHAKSSGHHLCKHSFPSPPAPSLSSDLEGERETQVLSPVIAVFDLRSAAILCFECSDYVPLPEESQTRVVSRLSQAGPLGASLHPPLDPTLADTLPSSSSSTIS